MTVATPVTAGDGRLWDVLPRDKVVTIDRLGALRSDAPVLAPEFIAALVDANPWLAVLRRLGYRVDVDPRMVPIEEGESSLNANFEQALDALLPLVAGAERGLRPTVVGNMTAGNHALAHCLRRLAAGSADPERVERALAAALGPPALAVARELLTASSRPAAKAFARLPLPLQQWRALRLPAGAVAAPDAAALARLAAALGLDRELTDELVAIREAMPAAGLASFADLWIVARSAWIHRAAALVGVGAVNHLPTSFEHLVCRATPEGFRSTTVHGLAAAYQTLFAAAGGRRRMAGRRIWSGRFRVLNWFDPVRALTVGERRAHADRLDFGWDFAAASFETGEVVASPAVQAWLDRPLAELLERGFGLSGKLIYMAVREVDRGAVCNLVQRSWSDVLLPLADPAHPCRALPVARVAIRADWRPEPVSPARPPPDFALVLAWLGRSRDPAGALRRLFAAFRARSADLDAPRSAVVLGAEPGTFWLREEDSRPPAPPPA